MSLAESPGEKRAPHVPLLSQTRLPRLWRTFQFWCGGSVDKRKLCFSLYEGQKRILEVGCSVGNIAAAMRRVPEISYTGVDIDKVAIDVARRAFRGQPNFEFRCADLCSERMAIGVFDYVLVAGVLHHIPDEGCMDLLAACHDVMASRASRLVVVEPLSPEQDDPWLDPVLKGLMADRIKLL